MLLSVAWTYQLCSVLRLHQHSISYMEDGFYRSKDPTNSIKVLKAMLQRRKKKTKTTKYTHTQTIIETKKYIHKISTTSPLVYTNMGWLGDGSQRAGSPGSVGLPPWYPLWTYRETTQVYADRPVRYISDGSCIFNWPRSDLFSLVSPHTYF